MKKEKRWGITTLVITGILAASVAVSTAVIDPFFHYHKPLNALQYPIINEWYQNDGIVSHFDYNAMITGTSMVENFKTSEFDGLFDTQSIKVPYAGASYLQINDLVKKAIKCNPNLNIVIRGLDFNRLTQDGVNAVSTYMPWPEYMYNDNPFDDIYYLMNKDVLLENTLMVLKYTLKNQGTTSFDQYACWGPQYTFGKESVISQYTRPEKNNEVVNATQNDYDSVSSNVQENVVQVALDNPNIEFYYFIPPYSIVYYDNPYRLGQLQKILDLHESAIKQMLPVPNIKIYSFLDLYDVVQDLDNYKDMYHYGEWINSDILKDIKNGDHLVTSDNYSSYCKSVNDFYLNYNYDVLFDTSSGH